MKSLVLVIGERNSGKSAIISSLTGCKDHSFRGDVVSKADGKIIFVINSSPQEEKLTPEEFSAILDRVHNTPTIIGLVVAVRPTFPHKRLSLENIIEKAQEHHIFDIHSFLLTPPYNESDIDVENTSHRLSALGITPHFLDARRFAFLNALDIKRVIGIP
jgi:energy-coupling factor transporter ATP-binding protein EcfA2